MVYFSSLFKQFLLNKYKTKQCQNEVLPRLILDPSVFYLILAQKGIKY